MTSAREQLGADLAPLLENYKIITDPRSIPELDPGKVGTVQIVQASFKLNPVAPQAQYLETMHVWAITHQKDQPTAEDDLDARVVEVTRALEALKAAGWDVADRMKHPDGHHAYRITATYTTDKE